MLVFECDFNCKNNQMATAQLIAVLLKDAHNNERKAMPLASLSRTNGHYLLHIFVSYPLCGRIHLCNIHDIFTGKWCLLLVAYAISKNDYNISSIW